jgi:hypothetical protein
MKKLLGIGLFVALFMPGFASAQSGFTGTWKTDMSKTKLSEKPDVYLLQNGMYQCKSCVPMTNIKADGQDQKLTGDPYADTLAVKVVDDHTVEETAKKGGKVVATSKAVVSADGNTLTVEFSDSSDSNGAPVTGKGISTRVAKGPAGSHAISGSWRNTKVNDFSDNGLTFTYKVDGDMLSFSTPTGQSFTAKLDGTDAPYKGDPGTTSVSVKRINNTTIEETDKRDGKAIGVGRATLSADGKTMTIVFTDKMRNATSTYVAVKQ